MVLEIVLGWKPSWFPICSLALQSVTASDQYTLPLLHGGVGWNDSDFYYIDFVQLQRRYPANAGENYPVLGWGLR